MRVDVFEKDKKVEVWFSSEDGKFKLSKQLDLMLRSLADEQFVNEHVEIITVDPDKKYQTMLGMGSSFEESTVNNFSRMSQEKRAEALKALVDPEVGAGMNLWRICFGSSDFTGRPWYTYDDVGPGETDINLEHFSIKKDIEYNITAIIKEAMAYNPEIKIFAAAWSPPGWMKTTDRIEGGDEKEGRMKSEYLPVLAKYYTKAIQAYEALGIPIYAISEINEPGVRVDYPMCIFTSEQLAELIILLKKEFNAAGINTKVWTLDYNPSEVDIVRRVFENSEALKLCDGVAFHDYSGDLEEIARLHEEYPEKDVFLTERSVWGTVGADRIIQYLRNWCRSYNAWVTFLDDEKQPNISSTKADNTLLMCPPGNPEDYRIMPEVYIIGQFVKFIKRGAYRIESSYGSKDTITNVAYENPDGSVVVVAVNQNDAPRRFKILCSGFQINAEIPAKTVATYKWKL